MKQFFSLTLTTLLLIFALSSCGLTVTQSENITAEAASSTTEKSRQETAASTTEKTSVSETTEKETSESTERKTEKSTTPTTKSTTAKTEKKVKSITCSVEISCKSILDNYDNLNENKKAFVPESGNILNLTEVTVPEGSTAFDVIKKACADNTCTDSCTFCKKNGIQLDYVYTPGYENYYIRGIHQIYEKDCGTQSGWMYCVNGVFPNYGCSQYTVKDGDTVKFLYTCDLGDDLGAGQ